MVNHADAFVNLTTMVTLQENNSLAIQTRYHMYRNTPRPAPGAAHPLYMPPHDMEPIFLCPHFDILAFLYNPYYWSRNKCLVCDNTGAHIISRMDSGRYIVVQGVRNLGGIPHPAHLTWLSTSRQRWNRTGRVWYFLQESRIDISQYPTEDLTSTH